MWVGVTPRFRQFHADLDVDKDEEEDAQRKLDGIVGCLNRSYYGETALDGTSMLVGSWNKQTLVAPPDDLDVYFLPPVAEFQRFNNYFGNGQSAFLQDVKSRLLETYPQTDMRGDGQVIVVRFNSITVELAPAFTRTDMKLLIPDTNDGGSWRVADPVGELATLDTCDAACRGNVRAILRMAKVWRDYCNVPLRSFQLELIVQRFMPLCFWRLQDYYYYDWIVRDFFEYLLSQKNQVLVVPGTGERMQLGDSWVSRAQTAYENALTACHYEQLDLVGYAGREWQKIFGDRIPENP